MGGAGFIGLNMAKELKRRGEGVVIVDRKYISDKAVCDTSIVCDFYSEKDFTTLLEDVKTVVFLVCNVGPQSSMEFIRDCYQENLIRLVHLLDDMRLKGSIDMVFISSGGTVYGDGYSSPIKEDCATNPENHYGIMKLAQEKIVLMYNRSYGMNNTVFRLANPYGPGQNIGSGVGAVTAFLKNIDSGDTVTIYEDCKEVIRDYIHIEDACRMMIDTVMMNSKEKNQQMGYVYNIGTGLGTSIYRLLEMIEVFLDKRAEVNVRKKRIADVKYNVLSVEKVSKVIGNTECRSLEDGIEDYYHVMKG